MNMGFHKRVFFHIVGCGLAFFLAVFPIIMMWALTISAFKSGLMR